MGMPIGIGLLSISFIVIVIRADYEQISKTILKRLEIDNKDIDLS